MKGQILYNSMLPTMLTTIILLLGLSKLSVSQSCSINYEYSDPNSLHCLPCPTSCLSCFDYQSCTACVDQYYLNSNICQPCQFGCAICTDAVTCTTCIDGLYVNSDGDCVACALGVKTCTIAIVQACKPGYFMLGTICAGCFDNCDICQDFATCTLCSIGYFVGPNQTSCQKCSNNCTVCQDSTTCTSCVQGYVLNGGACVLPSCSSISPFCNKCSNGLCQQCAFGKYVNSNGTCSQGSTLLCYSASGPYHTNCQTNLYSCPSYSSPQIDMFTNTQLPICIPLHASQNIEYLYNQYHFQTPTCTSTSASACSQPSNQTFNFTTMKSYFNLRYTISMKVYTTAVQDFVVNYLGTSGQILDYSLHSLNMTTQLSQNLQDSNCFNCKYGYTIIKGQLSVSGGSNKTNIQLQSLSSLFKVMQIMLQAELCKVERCSACTTAIDCIQCHQPYYLQLISCIEQCDPGFYKYGRTCVLVCPSQAYPIQSSYQCSKCISPCLTCSAQTQCLSCVDGYFLDGTSCLTTCTKPSLFTNITSKACEPCPNPCTECTVSISSPSPNITWTVSCSGCGVGYLLQQGNCTYICPDGTFANYINNKTQCSACQTGCTECTISSNLCLSCSLNYLLDSSTCHINYTCPSDFYVDNIINACEKCHFPCLTCSGADTNCTSCLKGAFYNNTCPLVCPLAMFIQYVNNAQICRNCASPCVQCISISICLTCINGTYLYNGQCLSSCPVQTYYPQSSNWTCLQCIPPCLQCISANQCLSCTTGYIIHSAYKCTLECPTSYYPDSNFACQQCSSPCISCFSPTICTKCALPHVLYNQSCISVAQCQALNRYVHYLLNYSSISLSYQSGTCDQCTYPCASCNNSPVVCATCVTGYLFVSDLKVCVQQCFQGYYQNGSQCLKCDLNCLACSISPTNCTLCGTSMYLYSVNRICVLQCPSHYFGSNQDQTCKPCQSPCLQCYNSYLCKSCNLGIYYNKACVSSCPEGSLLISNSSTTSCEQCTNNCLTCSITLSNCTQCPINGFYFYNNNCLTQCPTFYYADQLTHKCQACVQPCRECISATNCLSCSSGYYLISSRAKCVTECPQGYYNDILTNSCLPCNTTICRACSLSANNCTKCSATYYYSYLTQTCTQLCPISTYADPFYLQCRPCRFPCIACTLTTCTSCLSSYHLYFGNCYSECPIGFYANTNGSCSQCITLCQQCTDLANCVRCTTGYFVKNGLCVLACGVGMYGGWDVLTGVGICMSCPSQCIQCVSSYNCTVCQPGNYSLNGLCLNQCPSLYYPQTLTQTCLTCPQYCNRCTNSATCLQCINSYMYNNICYSTCPVKTYAFNEQQCIDCSLPCYSCTSQFSCLNCYPGYFYFQNYCVLECPDDVWKYPETASCAADCPYNKYVQKMECYVNGCGGMLVHNNGYCLDQCPTGYYVDQNQNCISCQTSSQSKKLCQNQMKGQLVMLRSYNLRACIYTSQLISASSFQKQKIQTSFYNKNTKQKISYQISSIVVDESMIIIEFGYNQLQLYVFEVRIPYIVSTQTKQSISYNLFKADVNVYNDYQYTRYEAGKRLLADVLDDQFDALYQPNTVINALAIIVVSACFVCVIINIICKNCHYRQLLDYLQFISVCLYLQIQYPPILTQFLNTLRLCLFSFQPQLLSTQPYTFSPSKLIQFNKDGSLLRSNGLLFIIFIVTLIAFTIIIVVNRHRSQWFVKAVARIKYRNVTDLFSIVSLPLLIFCFRFVQAQIADIICACLVLGLIGGFLGFMSYFLMTVKDLKQIAGLAGDLQATRSILGHMYTPFSFIRKIIFSLVLCIQPQKPLSSLTLLLIFTILIMVCLFFYQPFENQITDYICIGMEISLTIFVILIMLFGLNIVQGHSAHIMAILTDSVVILGAVIGLGWLVYLTFGGIIKFKKQIQSDIQAAKQQQNVQVIDNNGKKEGQIQSNSAAKIYKQNEQNHERRAHDEDEPSASELINQNNSKGKEGRKDSRFSEQLEEGNSEQNGDQFRHWNNSDSEKSSELGNHAPKYLYKIDKTQQHHIPKQESDKIE